MDHNRDLSMIGLHPSDPIAVDVVSIRSQWCHLSTKYSLPKERSKTFLILYCSSVYDELLRKCHSTIESTCQSDAQPSVADPDDVYYRFGGAAIASMLHSRYAQIKVGSLNAKHKLSIEISVLQKNQCS